MERTVTLTPKGNHKVWVSAGDDFNDEGGEETCICTRSTDIRVKDHSVV